MKEYINISRQIQEQAFRYIRASRAFHVGKVTSSGRTPDVLFGDQSPIKGVSDMNTGQKYGWQEDAQVLSVMLNGSPNNVSIIGLSPYIIGDVFEL